MARQRYTAADLDARLKFMLGLILGTILLFTTMGILYALIFVTQPIGAQSENDKMFFNVLGSVATFITGTLAGLLIGRSGAQEMMSALEEKKNGESESVAETTVTTTTTTTELVEEAPIGKPAGQVPDEHDIDEDWDKD